MKTMKFKNVCLLFILGLTLIACSPKDSDIQKAISEKMGSTPDMAGMVATVSEGVVTLTGECKDETCKASCESIVKGIKGVKSVINNCKVPAPVVINPDETLISSVNSAISSYAGVRANVSQGVVTLTGDIKKDDLMPLMQAIQALQPKKVENKLTIK